MVDMVTVPRETRMADLRAVRIRPLLILEKSFQREKKHILSPVFFFLPYVIHLTRLLFLPRGVEDALRIRG